MCCPHNLSRFIGRGGFSVVLGLGVPQGMVLAGLVGQQLLVGAPLDHLAVVKDGDLVAELAGGETVADINGCFVSHQIVEMGINLIFRHGIESRGGFVQDDKRRITVQRTGQRDFLRGLEALTARGKIAVIATQVMLEGSDAELYEVGFRAIHHCNVLQAYDMTVEAAAVKLMWILAQTHEFSEVRRLFYTSVGGDILTPEQ